MPKTVCLQHVPFEGPGAFATALTNLGVGLERYLVQKGGVPKDAGDLLLPIMEVLESSNPCRSSWRDDR